MNADARAVITGEAGYRERILPPPGAVALVTLSDVSRADAPAPVLAQDEVDLAGRSVPFSYRLEIDRSALQPRGRYSVRAVIRDGDGALLWTTDTTVLIDPAKAEQSLPPLRMVRAARQAADTGMPALVGAPWRVETIAGRGVIDNSTTTLQFGADGRLSGSTGCNSFSATYSIEGDRISIGQAAVTRRACIPGLDDQERRFLDLLGSVETVRVDARGGLVLATADGRTMVAHR